ncbi:FAS1 domain-containing protein [Cryomyces antarcticus]
MWPLLALGLSSLISSASAQQLSLKDTLATHKNLTSFYNFVSNNTQIYNALTSSAAFTLLAPSDEAMARISYTSLNTAFANADNDTIRAVLQYHVLQGTHPVSELTSGFEFLPTWLNTPAYSNITGGQRVGLVHGMGTRSTIVDRDIQTTNCLVHVVDNLLIPPTNFSTSFPQFNLTAAGGAFAAANLTPVLNAARDMTVFAPTNLAMQLIGTGLQNLSAAALAATMGLHVLNGTVLYSSGFRNGSVLRMGVGAAAGSNGTAAATANATLSFLSNAWYVNAAKVVQQDLLLANGVMHVLDNVLDPNNTSQLPNPSLPTQAPLIPGSAVPYVPFSTYLPCSGDSCTASASATTSATTTTTTTGAGASGSASASAKATTTSKAAAATAPAPLRVGSGLLAAVLALRVVA